MKKEEVVEALQESKKIDKFEEINTKGKVLSTVSIFSSIYGMVFWSSLFLPVGLFLSILGITVSFSVKNKIGIFLGIIGFILACIGLYYNPIWLTQWYSK